MATKKTATAKKPNLFKVSSADGRPQWVNLTYVQKVDFGRIAGLPGKYPFLVFAKFEVAVVRPEEIRALAKILKTTPEELTK